MGLSVSSKSMVLSPKARPLSECCERDEFPWEVQYLIICVIIYVTPQIIYLRPCTPQPCKFTLFAKVANVPARRH